MKHNAINIEQKSRDACIDIALDTVKIGKQAIIFVNTKRGAESLAEKIAEKLGLNDDKLKEISENILQALNSPTKQCHRLSSMILHGAAFHHAGLVSVQRKLIEDSFRQGYIKIIVATPTLAAGVDLPAFRVVVRDLKRFGLWGLQYIPVLEYEQQSGRAGRPSYDSYGEAICISDSEDEKDELYEKYILGKPEDIISKLAVEPIMRTYILSLIASQFVLNIKSLEEFFSMTFYAQHYGDMKKLNDIIHKMLFQLKDWNFVDIEGDKIDERKDFVSALKLTFKSFDKDRKLKATLLGKRVSELYLDPFTANFLIEHLQIISKGRAYNSLSFMHLVCSCLEMRPMIRVKVAQYDSMTEYLNQNSEFIITEQPEMFDEEFEEFLSSLKTARMFMEWLDEKSEEYILEQYDTRPGEFAAKKDIADWLLYSGEELSKLMKMHPLIKELAKLRYRLKYGAREELIPLLQLKNIGRVRARLLFNNKVKDISDVKKADLTSLSQLIGKAVALDIKKQVGQDLSPENVEIKENKRKGQINIKDYDE